jgi:predicted Zn-dependent peptidase
MIDYHHFTLENGLRVYLHQDLSVTTAVVNVIYNVGARDEDENKTGFAHLFEHLMFGGSVNIPVYDEPLQSVGGENNAFTSNDITNYYLTVPAANLETGLWLESDRMLGLSFEPNSLEVQRKVVIEEFNQRYLNQPYGDVWLKMRPLAYHTHPYKWATIGKEISHIEEAVMDDVKAFFNKHYVPANAVLVVAGNIDVVETEAMVRKWFGGIPAAPAPVRNLPVELSQTERRFLEVTAKVPADALYMVFHAPARFDDNFHASMLLSQWLGYGKSSLLYEKLVKDARIFSSISCGITASTDPGLLLIEGKLNAGKTIEEGEAAVWKLINQAIKSGISEETLSKIKNQAETALAFEEIEVLNRAMNIAFFALNDRVEDVNKESSKMQAVTRKQLDQLAHDLIKPEKVCVLYYHKSAEVITEA